MSDWWISWKKAELRGKLMGAGVALLLGFMIIYHFLALGRGLALLQTRLGANGAEIPTETPVHGAAQNPLLSPMAKPTKTVTPRSNPVPSATATRLPASRPSVQGLVLGDANLRAGP